MKTQMTSIRALLVGSTLLASSAVLAQTAAAPVAAPTAAPAAAGPTDPQIAAIVVAANSVDVEAGKLAKSRSKNKAVKAFAETMIRDHEGVNKQAKALVTKLKVKPEENATSKSLTEGGKENLAALKKLKGAEFDKAYVAHEVTYHEQVIAAVTTVLMPNVKNEELKALLEKSAPVFTAHLEHAKKLSGELAEAK